MTDRMLPCVVLALLAVSAPAAGFTPQFPQAAEQTGSRSERLTAYRLPVGPFADGAIDTRLIEGALDQRAWRFAAPGRSTLELLRPLRDQVTGAGYTLIYECEAVQCGGFDFRYGTEVLPEPDMHVDLGDFHYLAAERSGVAGPEYLSLIVSRAVDQGYVQITRIGAAATVPEVADLAGPSVTGVTPSADVPKALDAVGAVAPGGETGPLVERLATGGAQVLADLVFASGSAVLAQGPFASLTELAGFLTDNPGARVALVGHTDASGTLAANIALSRERARSVASTSSNNLVIQLLSSYLRPQEFP